MGYGAGLAVLLGTYDYTGGKLTGYERDSTVDEYERKEQLRKNWRRPIQETLEEVGEGRGQSVLLAREKTLSLISTTGVYGPGYDDRRRERIKQNYGIDVPTTSTREA